MPAQKANFWLKTKKLPLQQKLIGEAKTLGLQTFQRLFGLTQGWEKHRDIVKNNYELGLKHLSLGNIRDAILRFKLVTWLEPKHEGGWYRLGCAYVADGKLKLAKAALTRALQLKPDNEEAAYMLAIASGGNMPQDKLPKKMPLAMVREHFNLLAANFTQSQLETYHYQGHTLLCNAIRTSLTPGRIDNVVLELGCGTGLCGPQMQGVTAQLTGVDISAAMLEETMKLKDGSGKKIYDILINRDTHEFLRDAAAGSYDVVMAAGLFSYVGALDDIYAHVARVLKPGGIFAFTADKMEGEGFRLDPAAGRFRFSESYIEGLAKANGLKPVKCEDAPIYPNYDAWLCVFRK